MVESISDVISELDFYELHEIFLSNQYYDLLFPFLLAYAVFYAALSYVSFFKNKKTGQPRTPLLVIVSLLVSFYGVSFETSPGQTVGSLLSVMFPNISALTIGILSLYIVGSLLNKNMFKDVFRKDVSAYLYFAVGIIGFGAMLFYLGIATGALEHDVLDQMAYWNTIIAVLLIILSIVFLIIGLYPVALIFIFILISYFYNDLSSSESILSYFLDPFIFIATIFLGLLMWMGKGSPDEELQKLEVTLKDQEEALRKYGNNDSRVRDILDESYKSNQKKYEQLKTQLGR